METSRTQLVTTKARLYGAVCGGLLVLSMLSPANLWAKSVRHEIRHDSSQKEARPERTFWSRIAFSEDAPDFVPPPPRDDFDEQGFEENVQAESRDLELANDHPRDDSEFVGDTQAEPLFEGESGQFEPPVEGEPMALDPQQEEIIGGDLAPLPPQRDYFDPGTNTDAFAAGTWQVMPSGLMYRSYLAGEKEPRISSVWMKDQSGRTVWESTLGARVGLLRHGTTGAYRPQGWQLDFEGGALPRVLPGTESTMLEAVDFRVGIQSTWAIDRWHFKTGYYHLSSHLGDEFVIENPLVPRFNYVRDSTVTGVTYDITDNWQTYGELAYALGAEDGAKPIELQYGLQYSPLEFGLSGAPFAAINGHSRQDFGYVTSVNCQAGWQWRGVESQRLLRIGLQYYRGPALQYSFPGQNDRLFGAGMWIDF